jgi:ElaB/YqjD/DUF883 family membrane-anchored ribosome-binding protein
MRNNGQLQNSMHELRKDFGAVARDTEALLKATADVANDRVQEIRSRAEATLRHARETLDTRELSQKAREVAADTDRYVRDHRWSVIGAAAGIGLLLGLLARRH